MGACFVIVAAGCSAGSFEAPAPPDEVTENDVVEDESALDTTPGPRTITAGLESPRRALSYGESLYLLTGSGAAARIVRVPELGGGAVELAAVPGAKALTRSGSTLYFGGDQVGRIDVDGGSKRILASPASPATGPMSVGGGYAYWANELGLFRVPTTGGSVSQVRSGKVTAVTTDSAFSYYAREGFNAAGTVERVSHGGGAPTVIATLSTAIPHPLAIAADDTYVYWLAGAFEQGVSSGNAAGLYRAPKVGGSTELLRAFNESQQNLDLRVTSGNVYFTTHLGIWRVSKTSRVATYVVSHEEPDALAGDASFLYWTNKFGSVRRIAFGDIKGDRCTSTPTEVAATTEAFGMEQVGTWAFYSQPNAGRIWRVWRNGGTPELLATGRDHPTRVYATEGGVFWTERSKFTPGWSSIMVMPSVSMQEGPAAGQVMFGIFEALEPDFDKLQYWTSKVGSTGAIYRINWEGDTLERITAGVPERIATKYTTDTRVAPDGLRAMYWTETLPDGSVAVEGKSVSTGFEYRIATRWPEGDRIGAIALSDSYIYFVAHRRDGAWQLRRVSQAGGTSRLLLDGLGSPYDIQYNNGTITLGDNGATAASVKVVDSSGGAPRTLYSEDGAKIWGLDAGQCVWFAADHGDGSSGIMKVRP